jgi:hypothetical protein
MVFFQNTLLGYTQYLISTGLQPGVGWERGTLAVSTAFSDCLEAAEAADTACHFKSPG